MSPRGPESAESPQHEDRIERPAPLWASIVGQEPAIALLRRVVAQDRLAHAYAFIGPAGVGRRLTALAFAQGVLCPAGGCGFCSRCRRVAAGHHPDCQVLAPTPPKDNAKGAPLIRIEDIRALEHRAALAPHEGPCKIFILDDAERMTLPTAQALLKTLEEPPPRTLLILILANPRALPATVLSRCQRVRFRPLGEAELAAWLLARGVEAGTGRRLARWSQGQLGVAVALAADLATIETRRQAALDLLGTPFPRLLARLEETGLGRDRAVVSAYLEVYRMWFRDALCLQAGGDSALLVNVDRQEELTGLAARMSRAAIVGALVAVKEAAFALEGNVSPRLALEQALLAVAAA